MPRSFRHAMMFLQRGACPRCAAQSTAPRGRRLHLIGQQLQCFACSVCGVPYSLSMALPHGQFYGRLCVAIAAASTWQGKDIGITACLLMVVECCMCPITLACCQLLPSTPWRDGSTRQAAKWSAIISCATRVPCCQPCVAAWCVGLRDCVCL